MVSCGDASTVVLINLWCLVCLFQVCSTKKLGSQSFGWGFACPSVGQHQVKLSWSWQRRIDMPKRLETIQTQTNLLVMTKNFLEYTGDNPNILDKCNPISYWWYQPPVTRLCKLVGTVHFVDPFRWYIIFSIRLTISRIQGACTGSIFSLVKYATVFFSLPQAFIFNPFLSKALPWCQYVALFHFHVFEVFVIKWPIV